MGDNAKQKLLVFKLTWILLKNIVKKIASELQAMWFLINQHCNTCDSNPRTQHFFTS
jgi:hypothetical protein